MVMVVCEVLEELVVDIMVVVMVARLVVMG